LIFWSYLFIKLQAILGQQEPLGGNKQWSKKSCSNTAMAERNKEDQGKKSTPDIPKRQE